MKVQDETTNITAQHTAKLKMPTKKKKSPFWKHKDVNKGNKSFASGLNVYKIIWVFILGSVIGVLFETLYVFFMTGEWTRRSGMLYGPFNQVYGFGAVLFTLLLYRYRKKNAFIIFLVSAIAGGIFEYLSSWIQQIVFGSVSWEYSEMPANIGGRTNLFYMAGWGLMGLIFITHLWPFLSEMIERIPNRMVFKGKRSGNVLIVTGKSFTIAFAVFLLLNLSLSGAAVFRAGRRAEGVPAGNAVAKWLDYRYPDEVMAKKYPSMQFVNRLNGDNRYLSSSAQQTGNTSKKDNSTNG